VCALYYVCVHIQNYCIAAVTGIRKYFNCIRACTYEQTSIMLFMHIQTHHIVAVYVHKNFDTEIPTIIDPSATINYSSATGSIILGISVPVTPPACTTGENTVLSQVACTYPNIFHHTFYTHTNTSYRSCIRTYGIRYLNSGGVHYGGTDLFAQFVCRNHRIGLTRSDCHGANYFGVKMKWRGIYRRVDGRKSAYVRVYVCVCVCVCM
jgi:hypothetical protein